MVLPPPESGQVADDPEICDSRDSEIAKVASPTVQRQHKRRHRRPRQDEFYDDNSGAEFATGLEPPSFEIRELPQDYNKKFNSEPDGDDASVGSGTRVEPMRHPVDLDDLRLDDDAAKVVRRLTRHGYEAFPRGWLRS